MRTTLVLFVLAGIFSPHTHIVGQTFPVAEIPDSLKKSAHAVIRMSDQTFEVQGKSSAFLFRRETVTVLDDKGKESGRLAVYYSKNMSVKNYKGFIYDASGQLIKTIKGSDFDDVSAVSGFSLYDNTRQITFRPAVATLPYTVQYEYEIHFNGFINFPLWFPQNEYYLSLEDASYRITVPSGYSFRYKSGNIPEPGIQIQEKSDTYYWEIKGSRAVEEEIFSPSAYEFLPFVMAAPDEFVYEGYAGRLDTWENFGLWSHQLLEGRDLLPEEAVAKLNQLVADTDDPLEKTRRIYDYLQSTTRYVSIQLGIGGFQPFKAMEVDQTGYGDCKALSNYARAMLKAIGISSLYTQIYAGSAINELWVDFPSNQFNHVILCVPLETDTLWLECTDNTSPFGFLGSSTDNRHALVITDNGGVLVRTPTYDLADNSQVRHAVISLDETGLGQASVMTHFSGLQYDNISAWLFTSLEDQKDHYYQSIPYSNLKINRLELTYDDKPVPVAHEVLDLTIPAFATVSGKRLFLPLNPFNQLSFNIKAGKPRKNDILIRRSYWDTDTIEFILPSGYSIEYKPDDIQLETPFGEYTVTVNTENERIRYIREFKMLSGRHPVTSYPEMESFLKQIQLADQQKAVLIRQ